MLSYKNNHTVQPLYDIYVETDLDTSDDQPVDYSKKYADQDSYEDNRRGKTNVNSTNRFPTTEVSQTIKPNCKNSNDEVKVYCIEGTPITISSASSFCDLREVGASNSLQKSGLKRSFPSTTDDDISEESFEVKKSVESFNVKKDEPISQEKDEINKEVKTVSFRDGDDFSKASSPLMFSRSSSVCSLNSFEQHSIVDDRSSVSAISALTSGIVSPSDLPDSPGEVMSPALTDKGSSSKIDSSKADSDNESNHMELCEKDKESPENKNSNCEVDCMLLPKDYLSMQSNKPVKNSEDEILAQQLDLLHDSSAEMDEVFTNPEYENNAFILKSEMDLSDQASNKLDDSDEDDIFLQQCIQRGMPDKSSENKNSTQTRMECHAVSPESKINQGQLKASNSNKSADDSDGDDDMLQCCIMLGMPQNSSVKIRGDAEGFVKSNYSPHLVSNSARKDLSNQTSDKFDDDSDGDDFLLQQCIQRGMPTKIAENEDKGHVRRDYHTVSPNTKTNQVHIMKEVIKTNSELHHDRGSPPAKHGIQYQVPQKMSGNISVNVSTTNAIKCLSPIINRDENVKELSNQTSVNFDDDSDGDDILLQQCIQRGMPVKIPEKVELKDANPTKSADDSDEDDDMLKRCIQLGMPQNSSIKVRGDTEEFLKNKYSSLPVNSNTREELSNQRSFNFDDDDDSDGDDILLQQCIERGMPNKPSGKANGHAIRECHNVSLKTGKKKDVSNQRSVKCDEDSDDDDILQKCIQRGMPCKLPETKIIARRECHNASPKASCNQVHKKETAKPSAVLHHDRHSLLSQHCNQYGMHQKSGKVAANAKTDSAGKYPPPFRNKVENVVTKAFPLKSEQDSDRNEDNIYSQHYVQSRMPYMASEKLGSHSRMFHKPEYVSHTVNPSSQHELRDEYPDGISDGDEEDDLLAQCIRAGMPSSKIVNDGQNRLHNPQTGNISKKVPTPNHLFLPSACETGKKFGPRLPPNQPYATVHSSTTWISNTSFIDVDSMRIYQTENTPILSPSASISDLSSLSFNESFLNNSRNSDCSSESDDDELLLQCIRSGMPESKRATA